MVVVPGFLSGAGDFADLAQALGRRGIRTAVVPMPVWHWLPCLGGRGMRPILERIDHTVRHLCASAGDPAAVPGFSYSVADCFEDFQDNPGGVFEVGGSAEPDEYPTREPRGKFPQAGEPRGRVAIVGHSAGGWIARAYLSEREYGGKAYCGADLVHSVVTLGSPHADSRGAAFRGVAWVNQEPAPDSVRCLAVGATGSLGRDSGQLTRNAYKFCTGSDGSDVDGDGLTPTSSALAFEGAEQLLLDGATHFPWGDVFGGDIFAPELAQAYKEGKPWYGSDEMLDQWAPWLLEGSSARAPRSE